jgi:hypothetical protein
MIQFNKQLVTPSTAKQYLEANISNRRIKEPIVAQYANDMANGRWKEDTGELIKISKTGTILDGQHRLMAVIKSNKAINFHFATNLNDEIFDVLDTGSSRNATDAFKVKNIKHDNLIPSIIAMYNLLNLGRRAGVQKKDKATNAILLEQYYENETFWQNIAKQSHYMYKSFAKILPPSFIGGFYAYFIKLNPEKATEFMTQLATGSEVKNEVINMLRNKLMQDKMSPRKMTITLKMALIIKTWNLYIKGQTVKLLKFDSVRDEFPVAFDKAD